MFVGSAGESRAQDQMHLDSREQSTHAVQLSLQFTVFGSELAETKWHIKYHQEMEKLQS